jgi:acetyl-CoA carboxylase biotin carboxyl carrier protein
MRRLRSPVSGILRRYLIQVGDRVGAETEVALVESMKMEIPVLAESPGCVSALLAELDALIEEGAPLLDLDT